MILELHTIKKPSTDPMKWQLIINAKGNFRQKCTCQAQYGAHNLKHIDRGCYHMSRNP